MDELPKEIEGYKIPKAIRRSNLLKSLLATHNGRRVLADALVAGADAASKVLRQENKSKNQDDKNASIATEAILAAAGAAMSVLRSASYGYTAPAKSEIITGRSRKGHAVH